MSWNGSGRHKAVQRIETYVFWATVFIFMGAFLIHMNAFRRKSQTGVNLAIWFMWAGLAAHSLLLGLHWVSTGHPPVVDPYELQLSAAWFTVFMFLIFQQARMIPAVLGLMVGPVTFLLLGNAYASQSEPSEMGSLYATPWMIVHVAFAWLAFGNYALAAAAGVLILLHRKLDSRFPNRLPTLEKLDIASYRLIVLGIVNQTIMLLSGAIWAKKAWGHYWVWSALEAWALLSYLLYVFYLHVRRFLGWKMRTTAWIAAFGLVILTISYWGVKWLAPSLHPGP